MKNLVLIGYRGAGKSTVARLVAQRLGWVCLDTDLLIEQRAGRSVTEIFKQQGETSFREQERQAVALAAHARQTVIAVGGGAVMDEQNCRSLSAAGVFVYLQCGVDELTRRLEREPQRPRLTALPLNEEVAITLAQRRGIYERLAALTVNTGEMSAQQAADAIAQWVRGYQSFSSR